MHFRQLDCPTSTHTHSEKHWRELGEQTCSTPEEFKAWSQNLGHEKVLTTLTSYGQVDRVRQGDIIRKLGAPKAKDAHLIEIGRAVLAASGSVRV